MTLKDQYKKQRKRIQSSISRLKKEGFEIQFEMPNIPKKITASSVRRLSKIKPEDIRKKSLYVDYTTGEILSYKKEKKKIKKLIKERKSKLGVYIPTISIFDALIHRLSQFPQYDRFFGYDGSVHTVEVYEDYINPLVNLAKEEYENNDNYETYLTRISTELFEAIDNVLETKYIDEAEERVYKIANMLKSDGTLSLSESLYFNEYQEERF